MQRKICVCIFYINIWQPLYGPLILFFGNTLGLLFIFGTTSKRNKTSVCPLTENKVINRYYFKKPTNVIVYNEASGGDRHQKAVAACCMYNKVLWGRHKWGDWFSHAPLKCCPNHRLGSLFSYTTSSAALENKSQSLQSFRGQARFTTVRINIDIVLIWTYLQ